MKFYFSIFINLKNNIDFNEICRNFHIQITLHNLRNNWCLMTLKKWFIIFLVALVLYSAVAFVFPRLVEVESVDGKVGETHALVEVGAENATSVPESTSYFKKEPLGETPFFIEENVVMASLTALEKHGADLSKPMPSTHRVRCESSLAIDAISEWAEKAGFQVKPPETVHLHGGAEKFMVDLVKVEVPDISSIQAQGKSVASAAASVDGVTYATWVGAIVR